MSSKQQVGCLDPTEGCSKKEYSFTTEFMYELLENGYAKRVHGSDVGKRKRCMWCFHNIVWTTDRHQDQVLVVFDSCALFPFFFSLIKHFFQGPCLTNRLRGKLCRFRKEPLAIKIDEENMFYQFSIIKQHRDYFIFFWLDNEDFGRHQLNNEWQFTCSASRPHQVVQIQYLRNLLKINRLNFTKGLLISFIRTSVTMMEFSFRRWQANNLRECWSFSNKSQWKKRW